MYEDYFEPTLESEITELINENVKAKVQNVINRYERALKNLDIVNTKIKERESRLQVLDDELKKAETAAAEEIPVTHMRRIIEKYTGGYKPGQYIYIVDRYGEDVDCPCCKGTGKINVKYQDAALKIDCPECRGFGKQRIFEWGYRKHTIRQVILQINISSDRVRVDEFDMDCLQLEDGCLYAYDKDTVFSTEEEARQAIEKFKKDEKENDINSNIAYSDTNH